MQCSALSAFNPVKLVESLKLRATEQQDAKEYVALLARCISSIIDSPPKVLEAIHGASGQRIQKATQPGAQVTDSRPSEATTRSDDTHF